MMPLPWDVSPKEHNLAAGHSVISGNFAFWPFCHERQLYPWPLCPWELYPSQWKLHVAQVHGIINESLTQSASLIQQL